jgi:hypothetical protein
MRYVNLRLEAAPVLLGHLPIQGQTEAGEAGKGKEAP